MKRFCNTKVTFSIRIDLTWIWLVVNELNTQTHQPAEMQKHKSNIVLDDIDNKIILQMIW